MRLTLPILLTLAFAGWVAAQQGKPAGTQPGQVLPGPFTALVVTSPNAPKPPEGVVSEDRSNLGDLARVGKFHDFVTQFGLDPTVAVFSRELPEGADRPLGRLFKALDQAVAANRAARLRAFGMFLTLKGPFLEDAAQPVQEKKVHDFAEQLQLKYVPLALDLTDSDRTKAYDIPADATAVVLVYVNQTVRARHAFTADKALDDAAIQMILSDAKKMVAAK